MSFDDFPQRLARIEAEISRAARVSGRSAEDICLIAVTKGHPIDAMHRALEHGILDLGESRIQDALPKVSQLPAHARVHFIGRLQSNKVNKAVGAFASIMAVDRDDLVDRLARRASELEITQAIWIQVNATAEAQKGGCAPDAAEALVARARATGRLDVLGLMGMARLDAGASELRESFGALRRLAESIRANSDLPLGLSMGMSGDFAMAIEEGATHVRVGTGLFGTRPSA